MSDSSDRPTAKPSAPSHRSRQLAYSELMASMLDEGKRRQKARKIIAVLEHYLGREDLRGMTVVDVGSSGGFIADELARAGGRTIGVDIDAPGLAAARARFGAEVAFVCADGEALPLRDDSVDVLVLNHIYEHVVDADAVVAELHRVLAPDGVLYLGLGNRLGVMEPHYRLPFLSYLTAGLADRYVRLSGRADHYYERFRTRRGLRRMLRAFTVWDYTLPVIREPQRFASADVVPGAVSRVPVRALRGLLPVMPGYVWVASKQSGAPRGAALEPMPERITGAPPS